MTTTDPFTTNENLVAAMASADRIAEAGTLLDTVADLVATVEGHQYGQRSEELLLQYAEIGVQRAQASALLAVAFELAATRAELGALAGMHADLAAMRTELEKGRGEIGRALHSVASAVAPPYPRWWQVRERRRIRRLTSTSQKGSGR